MAANFVASERIENANLKDRIHTAVETIIQAQQAAMTAEMIGSAAAAGSSSN
ncbi:hypothetical protein [Peribacillus kribbensis]|uniref:hypothetical protein n=1 Tax=Peribacillus kribbensis TaxID=356658 RepID=UPI000415FAD1|nr:hypothetical protein [Peribacillus kribbensis]